MQYKIITVWWVFRWTDQINNDRLQIKGTDASESEGWSEELDEGLWEDIWEQRSFRDEEGGGEIELQNRIVEADRTTQEGGAGVIAECQH